MSAQKRSALILLLVVLLFVLGCAGKEEGLYKVNIKCPKPHQKVPETFEVKYDSEPLKGTEVAYLRVYLYNDKGYFVTLKHSEPVDGKEHSFKVELNAVPQTKKYYLKFQEVYIPRKGANARYFEKDIPLCQKPLKA